MPPLRCLAITGGGNIGRRLSQLLNCGRTVIYLYLFMFLHSVLFANRIVNDRLLFGDKFSQVKFITTLWSRDQMADNTTQKVAYRNNSRFPSFLSLKSACLNVSNYWLSCLSNRIC